MLSTGSLIRLFSCFLTLNATAREMGPTLPRNIVKIITIFPKISRVAVRFRERPTVAVALTVSKRISSAAASVTLARSKVEVRTVAKDIPTTPRAFPTACERSLLPKSLKTI